MDTNLPSSKRLASKAAAGVTTTGVFSTVLSIGAVVWAVGAFSGVATAQTPARIPVNQISHEEVAYSDLNLSTQEGARALLQRLDNAAKRVCGAEPSRSPLQPKLVAAYERCVSDAVDASVAQVNAPLVVALHTGAPESVGDVFAAR